MRWELALPDRSQEARVSTYEHYTTPVPPGTWDVPAAGATRFCWEYDEGRDRLLSLYQQGKDKQWDAAKRIDWTIPVDPASVMGMPEDLNPIYGSAQWDKLSQAERDELSHHLSSWLFSQFLHGEQGAHGSGPASEIACGNVRAPCGAPGLRVPFVTRGQAPACFWLAVAAAWLVR